MIWVCCFVQQLTQLLQDVNTTQDDLLPKKRFAFRSRRKENPSPTLQKTEAKLEGHKSIPAKALEDIVGFRNKKNEKLHLNVSEFLSNMEIWKAFDDTLVSFHTSQTEDLQGQDVNLSTLSSCEVRLYGAPSTVHMSKMDSCTYVVAQ